MLEKAENSTAQFWKKLGVQFRELSNDEERLQSLTLKTYTIVDLNSKREVADWRLDNGCLSEIQGKYGLLGAQEELELGDLPAPSVAPLQYWLHTLFQYLCEHKMPEAYSLSLLYKRKVGAAN